MEVVVLLIWDWLLNMSGKSLQMIFTLIFLIRRLKKLPLSK